MFGESFLKYARSVEWQEPTSETASSEVGLVDVRAANRLVDTGKVKLVTLPFHRLDGVSRSSRDGFSRRRYGWADPSRPGIVMPNKDGSYRLLDGRHRVLKMKDAGRDSADFFVVSRAQAGTMLASPMSKTAASMVGYTYVPEAAWPLIKKHGLHGATAMLKRPDLLATARPDESERQEWTNRVKAGAHEPHNQGPHVFFSMPDQSKIGPNHHINRLGLKPVAVDLGRLLRDQKKTRLFGVELTPYHLSKKPTDRERFLRHSEIRRLTGTSSADLWKHNHDPKNKYYAADVPHAAVVTPTGVVPAKYLKRVQ
jgi:hypothetical protein